MSLDRADVVIEGGPLVRQRVARYSGVPHTQNLRVGLFLRSHSCPTEILQQRRPTTAGRPPLPHAPTNDVMLNSNSPRTRLPAVCRTCGVTINPGRRYCLSCAVSYSKQGLIEAAKLGRVAGRSPEVRARQAEKQQRHAAALKAWKPSDKPDWRTEETYRKTIHPRLSGITVPTISSTLGISEPYAAKIRAGRYLPHPRHWVTLAQLVSLREVSL